MAASVSPTSSGWAMAIKLARRDLRGGMGALKLLFLCLLLGVMAMSAVGSLSTSLIKGLADQGQQLLGADIEARLAQREPTTAELAALSRNAEAVSTVIRMRAIARLMSTPSTDATATREILVELKAVDHQWPLYGDAALADGTGNAAVQMALKRGALLSQAAAEQLGAKIGDRISVGVSDFPIAAIITTEPDKAGEGFALGPSLLLRLDDLEKTQLVQPGSLYEHHTRIKLPAGTDPAPITEALKNEFPDTGWRLSDKRDGAPGVRRFVDRLGQFLALISLTSLAVAGVGVGNGVQSYLDRKSNSIATLKALGAPSVLILRTYLLVIGWVALLAAILGALIGAAIPYVVIAFAGDLLPVSPKMGLHLMPLLVAISFGLLVAYAFAVIPLARASAMPAQRMFRGSIEAWPWPSKRALGSAFGAGLLIATLAVLQSPERLFAIGFLAAASLVLALLFGLGSLVRHLAAKLPRPKSLLGRLAVSNLHRPGAMTRQLIVALGLGLSLFATLAFIESSFNAELQRTVPSKAPGYFLLDLPKDERERFEKTLPAGSELRLVPSLRGPVVAVNNIAVADLRDVPDGSYILRGDRGLTFSSEVPQGNRIVDGEWWPADYQGPSLVSMEVEQARLLGLNVGDTITVSVMGVEITAEIASLREVDWGSMGFNFVLVYDPATLSGAPYSYMATVTPPAQADQGFLGRISRAFPTVAIVKVKDVLQQVSTLVLQMGTAIRLAATVAILAGIAVLVGALAAQAKARTADNIILKTLGGTRKQIMAAAALEYAMLGAIVASVSLVLGGLSGWVVITKVLEFTWQPNWYQAAATVLAGALLTMLLGLFGAWQTLGVKVSSALREN